MTRETRSALALVVILAVFFQLIFIFADTRDTPDKIARQFASLYYKLDPAMTNLLCENLSSDDENVVESYIHKAGMEARERGLDVSYLRLQLYNVRTHMLKRDDNSAMIRITGEMKRGINPVFAYVGKLFFLGKTYPLDQTVNVIKENGKWKVCQGFFSASET